MEETDEFSLVLRTTAIVLPKMTACSIEVQVIFPQVCSTVMISWMVFEQVWRKFGDIFMENMLVTTDF